MGTMPFNWFDVFVVIFLTIGAFRALVLIEQGYTWAAWVTLGGIFVVAGAFLWTKRNP